MSDAPAQVTERPAVPSRRRRVRLLVLLVGVPLLLLALAPWWAAPLVRAELTSRWQERTGGEARLADLRLGWSGAAVEGLQLDEADGRPLLRATAAEVRVDVLGVLRGDYDADLRLADAELHLRRHADGRWNLEALLEAFDAGGPDDDDEDGDDGEDDGDDGDTRGAVRVGVQVGDARLVVHGPDAGSAAGHAPGTAPATPASPGAPAGTTATSGTTTLQLENLTVDLSHERDDQPFALAVAVIGPAGAAGRVTTEGALRLPGLGPAAPTDPGVEAEFAIVALDLSGFAPALAALGDLPAVGGRLDGGGRASWNGTGLLEADLDLGLVDLRVDDQLAPAPLQLRARATADAALAGDQTLTLSLGNAARLDWNGTTADPLGADGRLGGRLDLTADLAALAPLARPWVAALADTGFAGRLVVGGDLDAALGDGRPRHGDLSATAELTGLQLFDASGAAIPLHDLTTLRLTLDGSADLVAGDLDLSTLGFDAGPLGGTAELHLGGLLDGAPVLRPSRFDLRADLDALSPALTSLAGAPALGGRLEGRGSAEWTAAGSVVGDIDLGLAGLRIDDRAVPGLLSLTARAEADEQLAGTQTVRLALGDGLTLDWDGTTRTPLAGAGRLDGELGAVGDLAALVPLLRPWVPLAEGVDLAGALDVTATVGADLADGNPTAGSFDVALGLTGLAARDATGSELPLGTLDAVTVDLAGRFDLARGRVELPSLVLDAGPLGLEGRFAAEGLLDGAPVLEPSELGLRADLDALTVALADVLPPGLPRLGGVAVGRFEIRPRPGTPGEAPVDVVGALDVAGLRVAGLTAAGRTLDLGPGAVRLEHDLLFDPTPGGRSELRRLQLTSPWLRAQASGTVSGTGGPLDLRADLALPLAELATIVEQLRPGTKLQGRDVGVGLRLGGGPDGLAADGELTAPEFVLSWTGEDGRPRLVFAPDLSLGFAVGSTATDPATLLDHPLRLERVHLTLPGVEADLSGTISDLGADLPDADLTLTTRGQLDGVVAAAGSFTGPLPVGGRDFQTTHAVRLQGGRLRIDGNTTLEDLTLTVGEGPEALVIDEPRLSLDTTAALDLAAGTLDLTRLGLASGWLGGTVSGRVDGLGALTPSVADSVGAVGGAGPGAAAAEATADATPRPLDLRGIVADLRWEPSRVAPRLAQRVPLPQGVALEPGESQPLTLRLDGRWTGDPLELLRTATLDLGLGLGSWSLPGGTLSGPLRLRAEGGVVELDSQLVTSRGAAELGGRLDLDDARVAAGAPGAGLHLRLDGLGLTADLAQALTSLHPALAGLDGGSLTGLLDVDVDARWAGPVPREASLASLDLAPLSATGTLGLRGVDMSRSPFLRQMLSTLDPDGKLTLAVDPVSFAVAGGRVAYTEPWTWVVDGTSTAFRGSVGFDGSMDLAWDIPITEALADRHSFWERFVGTTVSIPVDGSLSAPRLRVENLVGDLAGSALDREVEERLGELDDLLGRGETDPQELLDRADALWAEGRQDEARPLYQALEKRHRLTLVYVLNKDRIKDRADEPKAPKPDGGKKQGKGGMGGGMGGGGD